MRIGDRSGKILPKPRCLLGQTVMKIESCNQMVRQCKLSQALNNLAPSSCQMDKSQIMWYSASARPKRRSYNCTTLWQWNEISLKTKRKAFNAAVRTFLLYGCETWPLRPQGIRWLFSYHWRLRPFLKIKQMRRNFQRNDSPVLQCTSDFVDYNGLDAFFVNLIELELPWHHHHTGWHRRLGEQLKTRLDTVFKKLNLASV